MLPDERGAVLARRRIAPEEEPCLYRCRTRRGSEPTRRLCRRRDSLNMPACRCRDLRSSRNLSLSEVMDASPQRCSTAFLSRSPRFSPTRTFSGNDPRALLAEDPFKGRHQYQYQSPRAYRQVFKNNYNLFGEDKFRYGVQVKEPKRAMQPFTSTLPRLTSNRPVGQSRKNPVGRQAGLHSLSCEATFRVSRVPVGAIQAPDRRRGGRLPTAHLPSPLRRRVVALIMSRGRVA